MKFPFLVNPPFPFAAENADVLQIKVAVIADLNGDRYAGPGPDGESDLEYLGDDSETGSPRSYQVVGFTKLNLLDVTINQGFPSYSDASQSCFSKEHAPDYKALGEGEAQDWITEEYPWNFQGSAGCNFIRARISCDTGFIPSTQASGAARPILVR